MSQLHSQKNHKVLSAILLSALLVGCASAPVPTNYAPSSVMSAKGSTGVSTFTYLPAMNGKVTSNQIRNTAIGDVKIDKDVSVFFRDAVFSELRFVGIKVDDPAHSLSGEIVEFLIDDLGYSIDWTLTVKYKLATASGTALYSSEKTVKRNTAKFANVFGALNETIKLNVEDLLKDKDFISAIQQ